MQVPNSGVWFNSCKSFMMVLLPHVIALFVSK